MIEDNERDEEEAGENDCDGNCQDTHQDTGSMSIWSAKPDEEWRCCGQSHKWSQAAKTSR